MTYPIRSILALSALVIVLGACGTTIGAPASESPAPSEPAAPSADPSVEPSATPTVEPTVAPDRDEEREVAGTITVAEGMAFSGPGGTIQEALDIGPTGEYPTLVNGILFRDTDGAIYLATAVTDESVPTFEAPMLKVIGIENTGPSWDMGNAELLNLQEANGIIFVQAQVLGYLEVH